MRPDRLLLPGLETGVCRNVQGTAMLNGIDLAAEFTLLDAYVSLGGNTFDTAENYGRGTSERVFGQWMRQRANRAGLTVIGKGGHPYGGVQRISPGAIRADLFSSLENLGTDCIDIYLLHRDDPAVDVSVIVDTLNMLHDAGHISAFGGSNWTHERIREANEYADRNGLVPFTVSSPQFSLADPLTPPWPGCVSISGSSQEPAQQWYADSGMLILVWSSLSGGFFSGRFGPTGDTDPRSEADQHCLGVYGTEENFGRLERANALAAEKDASSAQIALAFVLAQEFTGAAITGSRTVAEVQQNMAALEISLSAAEAAWLQHG